MTNPIKSQILAMLNGTTKAEEVHIDDLPEPIFIRHMSVAEQAKLAITHQRSEQEPEAATVALIRYGLSDADGNRVFGDSKDDTRVILDLPAKITGRLIQEISRVNFGKEVDEHEKNS